VLDGLQRGSKIRTFESIPNLRTFLIPSLSERVLRAGQVIETPFVLMHPDDDLFLPDALAIDLQIMNTNIDLTPLF